eukprot:CAMPEP_0115863120 /NCGR_PEP_ID=MMETSP0287-20121206/18530_1 /TAXON_ID=412157 /ORGANISM="Chrysochromulina rotalis, Strain UIO044" /LENGTH=957 /DNA_ID=CAMNT_0003317567 /DNA_START=37 /DNA_END=2910 /DNA_ORIENTATION=+
MRGLRSHFARAQPSAARPASSEPHGAGDAPPPVSEVCLHETAFLLADLRLSYAELEGLDGGVEISAATCEVRAWPLLDEAAAFNLQPSKLICGVRTMLVPVKGVADRRHPHEAFCLSSNAWWAGLNTSFFAATRTAPPPRSLIESGCVRIFVLPVDGEVNQRRVVMTTSEEHLTSVTARHPSCDRLHMAVEAAAAAPPVGEWPTTRSTIAHAGLACADTAASSGSALLDGYALFPHQARTVAWMAALEAGYHGMSTDGDPLPGLQLPGLPPPPEASVCVPMPRGGVIGHPVGSGKSRIVLALAATQQVRAMQNVQAVQATPAGRAAEAHEAHEASTQGDVVGTLVVCPAHLVEQWRNELATLGPAASSAVAIFSFDTLTESTTRERRWARLVVDEPQHFSSCHLAALRTCTHRGLFGFVWVLCGTAKEQLKRCAAVAWGGEVPSWGLEASARSSRDQSIRPWTVLCPQLSLSRIGLWERLAARFVRECCVSDAPGDCLPMPPLVETPCPVTLQVRDALLVQAHTRDGQIRRAVLLCNGVPEETWPERTRPMEQRMEHRVLDARDWEDKIESRWKCELGEISVYRDELRAEGDAAHARFLGTLGFACGCESSASFWLCGGRMSTGGRSGSGSTHGSTGDDNTGDGSGDDLRDTFRNAERDLREALNLDESQGVDDDLRDRFGKAQARVEKLERLLRWSENARAVLCDPEATCVICLEPIFPTSVAMWPCLHCVCDACADCWRRKHSAGESAVPCPHCKQTARRAELTIFGPRDGQHHGSQNTSAEAPVAPVASSLSRDGKLLELERLIHQLLGPAEERVVVFAQWDGVLKAVSDALKAAGIPHLSLAAGGLADRIAALRRFGQANEPRVLLLASDQHASGLNLQCARHIIMVHPCCPVANISTPDSLRRRSLSEAHAFDTQAIGRVRRFPQAQPVSCYRLYVRGTVEEELLSGQGVSL